MKRQGSNALRFGPRVGVLGLVFAAACGGGETRPPEAPRQPVASEVTEGTSSEAGSAKSAGPASTSSDDVKKGLVALEAGDLNGARAAFEVAVQKNPTQADAHHYLGLVNDQTGNKADAEKSYARALELQPDLEESAVNLAAILVETGRYDAAAALTKKGLAKNPKSAALQLNLAMALSGKDDVGGANAAFEEAIKLEPRSGIHLVTYAGHLARTNRRDEAIAKLKEAEKVASNDAGVLASVALEYKGLKEFKRCVAVLDKAVHVKDVAELRIYRGACKLGLKDLPGATTEFKDAVAKDPNSALARYSLGNALADGGKLTEAIAEWEAYVRLAPEGPHVKAAEKKIAIAKAKAGGPSKR